MLSSIREKFRNVKKNVNLFQNESHDKHNAIDKSGLNYNAGAEILYHFQEQWVEIHDTNEKIANNAEKVATTIDNLSKKIADDKVNIALIGHVFTHSNLSKNIASCLDRIEKLYEISERIEGDLITLEDIIEQAEFEKMKTQHRHHLEQYEIKKKETFEKLKQSLEEEHQAKLVAYEKNKQKVLAERQQVFQEAFKNDLEVYRNSGTIPKADLPKRQTNGALLEEIQLDYDQNELDQFFGENQS